MSYLRMSFLKWPIFKIYTRFKVSKYANKYFPSPSRVWSSSFFFLRWYVVILDLEDFTFTFLKEFFFCVQLKNLIEMVLLSSHRGSLILCVQGFWEPDSVVTMDTLLNLGVPFVTFVAFLGASWFTFLSSVFFSVKYNNHIRIILQLKDIKWNFHRSHVHKCKFFSLNLQYFDNIYFT